MKIAAEGDSFSFEFPNGGVRRVSLFEIMSIDLETMPTMTVDFDFVIVGFQNGEFLEFSDDAVGFREISACLSNKLGIRPAISERFPVPEGARERVYEKQPKQA
jgi:hypothetical protein